MNKNVKTCILLFGHVLACHEEGERMSDAAYVMLMFHVHMATKMPRQHTQTKLSSLYVLISFYRYSDI